MKTLHGSDDPSVHDLKKQLHAYQQSRDRSTLDGHDDALSMSLSAGLKSDAKSRPCSTPLATPGQF